MHVLQLPDHSLVDIFKNLDNKSKFNVALTCRHFNETVKASPKIYETFQLLLRGSAELPIITRPIPRIVITEVQLGSPEIFKPLLKYFQDNGKFLKNVIFDCTFADYHNLIKLMNLIPNVETLDLNELIITKTVEDENCDPVHNRFKKLSFLKIALIFSSNLQTNLFYDLFKDAEKIDTLCLDQCFNLIYGKPKLKSLQIVFNSRNPFELVPPSQSNVSSECWDEISIFDNSVNYEFDDESWNNMKRLILKQINIEKLSIVTRHDGAGFAFTEVIKHVSNLKSFNSFTISGKLAGDISTYMTTCSTVKELVIDYHRLDILRYFPNVKCLAIVNVTCTEEELPALTELKGLEKLSIISTESWFTSKIAQEFDTIIKNNPGISYLNMSVPCKISDITTQFQLKILEGLKKLKTFLCNPVFKDRDEIEKFSKMFVEVGDSLENLKYILTQPVDKKLIEFAIEYFAKNKPKMKFQYAAPKYNMIKFSFFPE